MSVRDRHLALSLFATLLLGVALYESAEGGDAPNPRDYVIGVEDVLEVSVWRNDDLKRVVTVGPDGKISFPLVQEIEAEGRTRSEIRHEITQKLLKFLVDPVVTVIVQEFRSRKVMVIGAVHDPGLYPLTRGLDAWQAIAEAGGPTEDALLKDVQLLRGDAENLKATTLDLRHGKPSQRKYLARTLEHADIVFVPRRPIRKIGYILEQIVPGLRAAMTGPARGGR